MANPKNKHLPRQSRYGLHRCSLLTPMLCFDPTIFNYLIRQLKSLNKSMRLSGKSAKRFIMGLTGIKCGLKANNAYYVTYAL